MNDDKFYLFPDKNYLLEDFVRVYMFVSELKNELL